MTFGDKLRELRLARGLPQKGLADAMGVRQSAVARWEAGQQIPAFDLVQALCAALGVECTVFNGCQHGKTEAPRGRGRPAKAEPPAPETKKPAKGKKKK